MTYTLIDIQSERFHQKIMRNCRKEILQVIHPQATNNPALSLSKKPQENQHEWAKSNKKATGLDNREKLPNCYDNKYINHRG